MKEISKEMDDFLSKVDRLCYEYHFEIWPTEKGWTGVMTNGEYDSIAIIGHNEIHKVTGIDGDGRGK